MLKPPLCLPSILLCALAVASQDDSGMKEALAKDRDRIARKPALLDPEKQLYSNAADLPAVEPRRQVKKYLLVVVPIAFSDTEGEERPKVLERLSEYLKENSGGAMELLVAFTSSIKLPQSRLEASIPKIGSEKEGAWVLKAMAEARVPKEADGVCLAYAGGLEPVKASMLWPHQTKIDRDGKTLPYYIAPQSGSSAAAIHCHEFLHLLGLNDKYERETPHCILAYGYEPLKLCAACRVDLGWIRVGRLAPEPSKKIRMKEGEPVRLELESGGVESLILEFRDGKLLVWHVLGSTCAFAAAIDGKSSDRLTPYSEPDFRGKSVGARACFITDVGMDKGQCYFKVSGSEALTDLEHYKLSKVGKVLTPK